MEGEASYSSFKLRCPDKSCMFSSSEYSPDELEAHREVHREEEQNDFSPASLRSDNTMESSDLNYNLLNENDPCLSDALPLPQLQELEEVNDFVQEIFSVSELLPVVAVAQFKVRPIPKLVQFSESNKYWHVKSGSTGNFSVKFSFDGLPQIVDEAEFQLKFELKRSHPNHEHIPVNVVCEKHLKDVISFPIIASSLADRTNYSNYKEKEESRKSFLLYKLGRPPVGTNQMSAEVSLRFPCNDTCVNTDFEDLLEKNKAGKVVMKEKSRFLNLSVSLEARQGEVTRKIPLVEEISIPVWIKSAIADRELKMTQRHKEKGGAANQIKMRKRSLPCSSDGGTDDKRQMTAAKPELSDLLRTLQPDQELVWKSLRETFSEDQRNMLSIMSQVPEEII